MRNARHIIAGLCWVIGGLIASLAVGNIFGSMVFTQLGNGMPEWIVAVYTWGTDISILVVPSMMAVLAIRGKLPGTRPRVAEGHGYPVIARHERE